MGVNSVTDSRREEVEEVCSKKLFSFAVAICKVLFERELALLVALQGESSWKGCWGDIELRH